MDLRTAVKEVLRAIKVDSAPTGGQAEIDAKIALIKAMRHCRRFRLGFNERWHIQQCQIDHDRYELPNDFVGMVQDYVFTVPANEFLYKSRLKSMPLSHINLIQQSGVVNPAYRETGPPLAYAIDTASRELVIFPMPSVTGDQIEFLYLADLGIPTYSWNGTAWKFYVPGTTEEIAVDFSNEWLNEEAGYELVFNRACLTLLAREYGGTPETDMKAQAFQLGFQESLERLRSEANKAKSVTEIVRHM